tara:strand:- start:12340 stop:12555 length:216 start_codon:yes stop_codon:yes gene_type:complete
MNELFQTCVDLLRELAAYIGCSYEEINIVIFLIIHPAITIYFIYKYREAYREFYKLREMYWKYMNRYTEKE